MQQNKTNHFSAPGVILYLEYAGAIRQLKVREKAQLLDAILEYGQYGAEPELDKTVGVLWQVIRPGIDRSMERYTNTVLQRKYAVYSRETRRRGREPLSYGRWLEAQTEAETEPLPQDPPVLPEETESTVTDREIMELWKQRKQDFAQQAGG